MNTAQKRQRLVTVRIDMKTIPWRARLRLLLKGSIWLLVRRKNHFGEFEITGVKITETA